MSLSLGLGTISIKIAHLDRHVVGKVGLDPDSREVEIELKLPEECAKHAEAEARIGALRIGHFE